jgi:hypothetical protein
MTRLRRGVQLGIGTTNTGKKNMIIFWGEVAITWVSTVLVHSGLEALFNVDCPYPPRLPLEA